MVNLHFFNEKYFPDKENYVCPPSGSKSCSTQLYRFTSTAPSPCEKDWEAATQSEIKRKRWIKSNDYKTMCKGAGVSYFPSEEDAQKALEHNGHRSRGAARKFNGIFKVNVNKSDGILYDTSNPNNSYKHFTFWINSASNITSRNTICN